MITDHDRRLAREVIDTAIKRRLAGETDDNDFDAVLHERFPMRDRGGVSMNHRKTVAAVRQAIREFYAPDDWYPEPTTQSDS